MDFNNMLAMVDTLFPGASDGGPFAALALAGPQWAICDDEIEKAMRRHSDHADLIWHSFRLLTQLDLLDKPDWVYRSHCREILDRVARGEDTRPGTAAEICALMSKVTQATPVTDTAAGLYMRMWKAAGFPENPGFDRLDHHEALHADTIDAHEAFARRKLADPERVKNPAEITCKGIHDGEPVTCVYAIPK